jgi:hypothetical protein
MTMNETRNTGKRIILTGLFCSFLINISYGQAALLVLILGDKVATEKFHLSIDGGLNISSLPDFNSGKTIIGVNFGLGTHIKLGEKWHLKPEFKPLSYKGAKQINPITSVPGEIENGETKIRLNYIDVPVLLQYNITPKLFVSAGPQISFLTSASQITKGILNDRDVSIDLDTKTMFNKTDVSFTSEIGYSFSIQTKKSTAKADVDVFLRYNYGFMEVFKEPSTGSSKSSTWQVGLSLPFIKSSEELSKSGN